MKKKRMVTDRLLSDDPFYFCDDLGAPELLVVLNQRWLRENREQILGSPGVQSLHSDSHLLVIDDPRDRLVFRLRWT